jgi:tetratricopeptide (TPR) repeat protein
VKPETFHFDAEVRELLREIAADPASTLLRIDPSRAKRELRATPTIVRPSATLLSRAERELIRAHRACIVASLRMAYTMKLYCGEQFERRRNLMRSVTADVRIETPTHEHWARAARIEMDRSRGTPGFEDGLALLERCLSRSGWAAVSLPQLVAAAQRLAPSDHARLAAGVYAVLQGDTSTALRYFDEVVVAPSRCIDAAYAHFDRGWALEHRGELDRAIEASRSALAIDGALVGPRVNVFFYHVLAGNDRQALEAARHIDALLQPGDPALFDCCRTVRGALRRRSGKDKAVLARSFTSIADQVGPLSRSIVHALLE